MGMFDMMGKLNELKKNVEETKAQLSEIEIEGESGGGLVRVKGNAMRQISQIEIDDALISPERKEELEDLLVVAINRMLDKARIREEDELKKAAGGLIPPGLGF